MLADAWEEIREPGVGTNGLGSHGVDSGRLASMENEYKQSVYRKWLKNKQASGGLVSPKRERVKMDPGQLRQERQDKKERKEQELDAKLTKAEANVRRMKKKQNGWLEETRVRDMQWIDMSREFSEHTRLQREAFRDAHEFKLALRQEAIVRDRYDLREKVRRVREEKRVEEETKRANLNRTIPSPSKAAPKKLHPLDTKKQETVQAMKAAKEANRKLLQSLNGETKKGFNDTIRAERDRRKEEAERKREIREVEVMKKKEQLKASFFQLSKGILEDRVKEQEEKRETYRHRKALSPTYRYYYYYSQ
eukprot:TRINITY_DN22751_c0_g1_i1.p1 TRINITY_DN22751_c0_g1~~TRINITY_DN22751_c0_g1_i1.p1  ORF type:complete len:307 (+),score=125.29 TRINITY_DN22751_c0_g1_i1:56-976(+)